MIYFITYMLIGLAITIYGLRYSYDKLVEECKTCWIEYPWLLIPSLVVAFVICMSTWPITLVAGFIIEVITENE